MYSINTSPIHLIAPGSRMVKSVEFPDFIPFLSSKAKFLPFQYRTDINKNISDKEDTGI